MTIMNQSVTRAVSGALLVMTMTGLGMMSENVSAKQFVYVSNAKSGTITRYLFDEKQAALTPQGATVAGDNVAPLAVSPDKTHLYASIRSEPFKVVSYKIDAASGDLLKEGEAPLVASMAYIDTDHTGHYLFAASYGGSLISASPITDNGSQVQKAQQVLQTGRNAHAVHASLDNRFVFSTSLGDDEIMQYKFDQQTGELTANTPASVKANPLVGPRHFLFSPNGKFVYVVGEFSGSVTTFAYHAKTGLLTSLGESEGVPAKLLGLENGVPSSVKALNDKPKIWAADIHISPDGRFLYVSERTKSVIAVLEIDQKTGLPVYKDKVQVERQPRGFALTKDGRFMIVASEKDSHIGLYQLDSASGMPKKVASAPTGEGANWVEIVSLP